MGLVKADTIITVQVNAQHLPPAQPIGATVISSSDGEITIVFRPTGMIASAGHVAFSLGFMLIGIVLLARVPIFPGARIEWWLLVGGFLMSGAYLLLSTIQRARLRTFVKLTKETLEVRLLGPFRSTRRSWPRNDILDLSLSAYRLIECRDRNGKRSVIPLHWSLAEIMWVFILLRTLLALAPLHAGRRPLPPDTRVDWSKNSDVATIVLPPNRLSYGWFTVLLLAMQVGLTVGLVLRASERRSGDEPGAIICTILFLWAVLTPSVLFFWQKLRFPATFEVSAEMLTVTAPALLGCRARRWPRNEIEDITAAGDRIVLWRKKPGRSRPLALADGGTPADVRWIAQTLRCELRLPEELFDVTD
jgi:hypothetical protein